MGVVRGAGRGQWATSNGHRLRRARYELCTHYAVAVYRSSPKLPMVTLHMALPATVVDNVHVLLQSALSVISDNLSPFCHYSLSLVGGHIALSFPLIVDFLNYLLTRTTASRLEMNSIKLWVKRFLCLYSIIYNLLLILNCSTKYKLCVLISVNVTKTSLDLIFVFRIFHVLLRTTWVLLGKILNI